MDIVASVIAGLLLVVGALGTIFPMLPGSVTVIVGLLLWALVIGGNVGWTVFALGFALCAAGMTSSALLTGTRLKKRAIPNRSILIGAVTGIVGALLIPVVGLVVGFIVGLVGSEWVRLGELSPALDSSKVALTSVGLGMIIEFGCAGAAIAVWVIGLFVHF